MTGNNSVYLYTGIEGQYGVGPIKILPSFTPGYYEKGNGKDLGSVLEFKSEIKIGLIFLKIQKLVTVIVIFQIMIGVILILEQIINKSRFLKIF